MNKKLLIFISICLLFMGFTNVYADEEVVCELQKEDTTYIKYSAKFITDKLETGTLIYRYPADKEVEYSEDFVYLAEYNDESKAIVKTISGSDYNFEFDFKNYDEVILTSSLLRKYYGNTTTELIDKLTSEGFKCISSSLKPAYTNTYTNENTNFTAFIEDNADLLTEEEEKKLLDEMIPLTKYGHIAFNSISSNDLSTESYASKYYHNKFGYDSGTVFIIDMDNRNIYIFSDGDNYNVITIDKANLITDNIYRYATKKEYYRCASLAFSQIRTLLEGGKIAEPMRYISNILISVTVGAFISFGVVRGATKLRPASDSEILKNCDISFAAGDASVKKNGQKRVYSPQSSSSSGGGGGGGGGGGSSGGGGGHSF